MSSGYLEGTDAFESVLDKLIAAESSAGQFRGERDAARAEATEARRSALAEAKSRAATQAAFDAAVRDRTPVLKALWEAADAFLKSVTACSSAQPKSELLKAMEAAREFCDQPPF